MPQPGPRIYNLFPRLVGPVSRWTQELPRIAGMEFDTVYLNPFHATGGSGSLYAVADYYRLNAMFDEGGSAERQLASFTAAAARHRLLPMMDLVLNHTARDSDLVAAHPGWYVRAADGSPRAPRAIDPADARRVTIWGDLAELDFSAGGERAAIIAYFVAVLRHYIGLGFRGFRCDAAYKVPGAVWRELIAAARAEAADCVFCAETVGGPLDEVQDLAGAGFDYLYNSVKWWDWRSPWLLEQYDELRRIAPSIGFPESHDTERLAAELAEQGIAEPARVAAEYRLRYALAACFASGIMMPMGYEWGWRRRLDVTASQPCQGETRHFDISDFIAGVNRMKRDTPALNEEGPQRVLSAADDAVLVLGRRQQAAEEWAFTLVNSDAATAREIATDDLLAAVEGQRIALAEVTPGAEAPVTALSLVLEPGQFRVLRGRAPAPTRRPARSAAAEPRDARIAILDVWPDVDCGRYPIKRVVGDDVEVWADILREGHDQIAAVVTWRRADADQWNEAPMRLVDNDRWSGRFVLDDNARYRYSIEAWTDHFASWCEEVAKKRRAGRETTLELPEGRALIATAATRAEREDAGHLAALLAACDAAAAEADRAALLLSRMTRNLMARCADRSDAVALDRERDIVVDRKQARFGAWYEMFPRSQGRVPGASASFADCIERLPEIAALGFDIVYLVPIHPIGRINRKGRDNALVATQEDPGSPYAIGAAEGGHRAVHPALGTLADFRRFVAAAQAQGMEVALDFAVQCAPDHPWVEQHPEWFTFRPDGTIKHAENPPKKYEDIVNVDFYNRDRDGLWRELRDTLLFWVEQGVRIFRVDNPHTKPMPFWEWCIREVQARDPGIIFLAEAFTRPGPMYRLAKLGFSQSYSYFTWRNTKAELTEYLSELTRGPEKEYFRPNFFANTPDILPEFLQRGGRPAFLIRLVLAATLSPAYGIYNGFELCENAALPGREEYIHSEKYEYKVWDWHRPGNIKHEIAQLNRFRRDNPALALFTNLVFCPAHDPHILAYAKFLPDGSNLVLVVVNLDPAAAHEAAVELPVQALQPGLASRLAAEELFTGAREVWHGPHRRIRLDPAAQPAAIFRLAPLAAAD